MDWNGASPFSLPRPGEKLLLIERSVELQKAHNELVVKAGESPGQFFIFTGRVHAHLYASPGSRLYFHYSGAQEKLLKEAFVRENVEIPPTTVFVSHGYVQHEGSEWRGQHCNGHHDYPVLESHEPPDAITFAYGEGVALETKKTAVSLKSGLDQQEGDPDGDVLSRDGYKKRSDSEKSE